LLDFGIINRGKSPFQFKNMWLKVDGFLYKVRGWWDSYHFQGSPSYILAHKLKALKMDLKRWNKEEFGNVTGRKNSIFASIKAFEDLEESRDLTSEERLQKDQTIEELEKTLLMEEICWRQKSRFLWLREGDKNTRFFHRTTNSHRRHNTIEHLDVDGEVVTDSAKINQKIVEFYQNHFSEPRIRRPLVNDLPFSFIGSEDAASLDGPVTEEEVFGGCFFYVWR
jgi:hypothetical protein